MSRKSVFFRVSTLHCLSCGASMPIPRRIGRLREKNHIKTMWCYRCRRKSQFIENAVA